MKIITNAFKYFDQKDETTFLPKSNIVAILRMRDSDGEVFYERRIASLETDGDEWFVEVLHEIEDVSDLEDEEGNEFITESELARSEIVIYKEVVYN